MNTLLILNGPKCSGKSSVAKELWKISDKTILLSLDTICWLYSSYDKEKVYSLDLAGRVCMRMIEVYLTDGLDVIVEKAFNFYKYIEPFLEFKNKLNAKVVLVNVESPENVLIERAKTRVNSSMKEDTKITTEDSIKLSYDNYVKNKFLVDSTYDSSKLSIDQIVADIKKNYF